MDAVGLERVLALADRLGVTVAPMIVPEYLWHLVFTRDYDQPPDDRFVALATRVGMDSGLSSTTFAIAAIFASVSWVQTTKSDCLHIQKKPCSTSRRKLA